MKASLARMLKKIAISLDPTTADPDTATTDTLGPKRKTFAEAQQTRIKHRKAQAGLEELAENPAQQRNTEKIKKLIQEKEDKFNDAQLG